MLAQLLFFMLLSPGSRGGGVHLPDSVGEKNAVIDVVYAALLLGPQFHFNHKLKFL